MADAPARPLRLLAEDADDLALISAALQDAVTTVGGVSFDARARALTVVVNRYRWEAGGAARVRAALQLGSVTGVQSRRLRRDSKDAVIELLAVEFEPGEAPGGVVTLRFAGDADLRAAVECVDAVLADVSSPWPTRRKPHHEG